MGKLFLAIIIFIMAIIWLFTLAGCSEAKKIERAKQTVRLDKKSFDEVGNDFVKLHPCANDTLFKFIKGGTDSIPYPVITFDSTAFKDFQDSLSISDGEFYNNGVEKSFVEGFDAAKNKFAGKKIAVQKPDTIIQTILDVQKQRLLEDQINMLDVEDGIARGESAQKDKEINSIKAEKKKWMWWLIGILMAEGIGAGIYAYTKFSNPIGLIKKL